MIENDCSVEVWKLVSGYTSYEVSNHGRVRKVDGDKTVLLKIGTTSRGGYCRVNLNDGQSIKTYRVHSLVLVAFVGIRPEGFETRHLDGNPRNNRVDNLAWGTPKENSKDRITHQTQSRGQLHGRAKMNNQKAIEVARLYEAGTEIKSIADRMCVHFNTIYFIVSGRTWVNVTGIKRANLRKSKAFPNGASAPRATWGN